MAISQSNQNRLLGQEFEKVLLTEAKYRGLYARKNHIAAKFGWKGKLMPVKGQLDFTIVEPGGAVGFFDAKSFQEDHFTFSDIDPDQLAQSVLFNELGVPSGFVVNFRKSGAVVYYNALEIDRGGPGKRFESSEGVRLGNIFDFDLRPIMQKSGALPVSPFRCIRKPKKACSSELESRAGS